MSDRSLKEEFETSFTEMTGILETHLREKGLPEDLVERIHR
ncbi:hypothetical protein MY10362_008887, partial [Beauveria mimosiformis]